MRSGLRCCCRNRSGRRPFFELRGRFRFRKSFSRSRETSSPPDSKAGLATRWATGRTIAPATGLAAESSTLTVVAKTLAVVAKTERRRVAPILVGDAQTVSTGFAKTHAKFARWISSTRFDHRHQNDARAQTLSRPNRVFLWAIPSGWFRPSRGSHRGACSRPNGPTSWDDRSWPNAAPHPLFPSSLPPLRAPVCPRPLLSFSPTPAGVPLPTRFRRFRFHPRRPRSRIRCRFRQSRQNPQSRRLLRVATHRKSTWCVTDRKTFAFLMRRFSSHRTSLRAVVATIAKSQTDSLRNFEIQRAS